MNAILDSRNNIIGYTTQDSHEIKIAGAIAVDGAPVNIKTYRISKSKANRARISVEMPCTIVHEHNSQVFSTLEG